jgi:hypothetical protein
MLKNKAQRNFNAKSVFSAVVFIIYCGSSCFSQTDKTSNCYILAAGKKIPLFSQLSDIRKKLLVSRDIEYLDTLIFLYSYNEKIEKIENILITPQIAFFVDTSTKQTIKEELYYSFERERTGGNITKTDLKKIFEIIRNQSVPFLEAPQDLDFGKTYKLTSVCYRYQIEISKVKEEYPYKSRDELAIKISFVRHE